MLTFMKKHKKIMILLLVLILLVTALLVLRSKTREAMAALSGLSEETAFVERRSIQSSISSTGKVISDNTRDITAYATGLEVLTVNVEVGDVVMAGDILCTFDTADLEESLEDAEKSLSAARTQSNVSVNNAKRALEQAIETQNYQIESAARNVISAHDAYEDAAEAYDEVKDKADEASDAVKAAEKALKALPASIEQTAEYQALQTAQQVYDEAKAKLDAFVPDGTDDDTELAALTATADAAKTDLDIKQAALDALDLDTKRAQAQAALSAAETAYDSIKPSLDTAKRAMNTAWNSLQSAESAYEYTVASQQTSYQGSKDALKSAQAGAGVATIQQQNAVESYKDQIEKGILTASIGGTVTAVNINPGELYAGGPLFTLQDCNELVVSAEIDEYDISDITIGMKAVFKTDATRDEQLTGEVIFISPTPTLGSDVTYQVKVSIDSPTDRLRLGMNARLNIILQETGSVLTVPYDAIQQDEQGNDIVYLVSRAADGTVTKTAVPVTVGVEGDYYVEIIGNITEGAEVSLPSDNLLDLDAIQEQMMSSMMG